MEAWDRRDPEGSEAYEGPALPQSAGGPWIGLVSLYIASTPCQMGGLPAPLPFRWGFSSSPSPPPPPVSVGFQPPQRRPARRPGSAKRRRLRRGAPRQVAPARPLGRPTANGHRQRPGHAAAGERAGGVTVATARDFWGGVGHHHIFLFIVPQIADLGRDTAPL